MKKRIFPLLFITLLWQSINGFCQPPTSYSKKDYQEFLLRTVIVQVEEPNDNVIKDLQKNRPNMIKKYQNAVDSYNVHMKGVIERYWHLKNDIVYKTLSEIKALSDEEMEKYVVLRCVTRSSSQTMSKNNSNTHPTDPNGYSSSTEVRSLDYLDFKDLSPHDNVGNIISSVMECWRAEKVGKYFSDPFAQVSTSSDLSDCMTCLIVALYKIQQSLNMEMYYSRENKSSDSLYTSLKVKTLVLPVEKFGPEMNEAKFKKLYPYKFKVIPYPEFENAITNPKDDLVVFYGSVLIFTVNGRSIVVGALGPGDVGSFYYDKNLTIKDKTVEFLIKRIDWSSRAR